MFFCSIYILNFKRWMIKVSWRFTHFSYTFAIPTFSFKIINKLNLPYVYGESILFIMQNTVLTWCKWSWPLAKDHYLSFYSHTAVLTKKYDILIRKRVRHIPSKSVDENSLQTSKLGRAHTLELSGYEEHGLHGFNIYASKE